MSKFEKSMTEIFDVLPTSEVSHEIATVDSNPTQFGSPARLEDDLDQDYEESRKTLKDLVNKGNQAIDHLLAIASESEHPRAFEVVATLIKNIKRTTAGVTVDKAIFVGSTSELSKLLKARNNGDE